MFEQTQEAAPPLAITAPFAIYRDTAVNLCVEDIYGCVVNHGSTYTLPVEAGGGLFVDGRA